MAVFRLLRPLGTHAELILAQLHGLLTKMNAAYFAADKRPADDRWAKYLEFQLFVEDNLTEHPTIERIAEDLAISTDALYQLMKHYASPQGVPDQLAHAGGLVPPALPGMVLGEGTGV